MARPGPKPKVGVPRKPGGGIRNSAKTPKAVFEFTRPPEEQLSKREAILGSRTKPGDLADPLTHLRGKLTTPQYEAAMAFRRAGHAFLDSIGYQHRSKSVLGSQQAQGAIRGLWHFNDGNWPERDKYTAALNSIRDSNQGTVAYTVCISEGYRFEGGDPALYYSRTLEPIAEALKGALTDLAKHYGYDKVAKSNRWLTDKPCGIAETDMHWRNRSFGEEGA